MRLLAISDVHVRNPANREFISKLPPSPNDWLILGGDIGEREEDLRFVLSELTPRFARLVWVPGNHELWTVEKGGLRGERRYQSFVELCRSFGTLTPEDPYEVIGEDDGKKLVVAPLFLLYDYTFCPPEIGPERAVEWAAETDIVCTDEVVLHPDPFPTREAWCRERCRITEQRLSALGDDVSTILVNHFPLRREHAVLPRVPRFSIWCGTVQTEDWHRRFRARAVVFGHLHIRQERVVDGVPFHEVSLGYPGQFDPSTPERYLREIWSG